MAKYILLAGDNYYPSPWDDVKDSSDSLDELLNIVLLSFFNWKCDWWVIFDTDTCKEVASGSRSQMEVAERIDKNKTT